MAIKSPNAGLIGAVDGRMRLQTPALVLEASIFERNLARMAAIAAARGVALRPHAKTHKSVAIARRQVAAGAIGVSCTILREAEAMVDAGIPGVLLTSPVVPAGAIDRLVALARRAGPGGVMVVVDDPRNAAALSAAAATLQHPLDVLVDYSASYHRTGTATPAAAIALARTIVGLPHLSLRGLQAYAGNIQHIVAHDERAARAGALRDAVAGLVAAAAAAGSPCRSSPAAAPGPMPSTGRPSPSSSPDPTCSATRNTGRFSPTALPNRPSRRPCSCRPAS